MEITAETLEALGPMTGGHDLVPRGLTFDGDVDQMADEIVGHFIESAKAAGHASPGDSANLFCPLLLFLDEDATIEHLDPEDMFRAGWVRVDDGKISSGHHRAAAMRALGHDVGVRKRMVCTECGHTKDLVAIDGQISIDQMEGWTFPPVRCPSCA